MSGPCLPSSSNCSLLGPEALYRSTLGRLHLNRFFYPSSAPRRVTHAPSSSL